MQALVGTIFEIFQYLSLACSILVIFFVVKRGIHNKRLIMDIPIIVWMLHSILYYVSVFVVRSGIVQSPPLFFTSWSTALRFHGYATLLIMSILNYKVELTKWIQR